MPPAIVIGTANRLSEFIEALAGSEPLEWNPRSIGKTSREPTRGGLGQRPGAGAYAPENSGIADYFAARKMPFEPE